MAITSTQVTLSGSATVAYMPKQASIEDVTPGLVRNINASGGTVMYLGGATVSSSNGFPLNPGESLPLSMFAGDILYATGTGTLAILLGRQN